MPGGHYIALSGLRSRADDLDRIATDIANIGTAGYKGERERRTAVERDSFDTALQTAIDTTSGGRRLDLTGGAISTTGRPLDLAIDGDGFFAVETANGTRYTRNGQFTRDAAGQLTTAEGGVVMGAEGPIVLGNDGGKINVDADGSVWVGATQAGRLAVVTFEDPSLLQREGSTLLRADGQTAQAVAAPVVRSGSLEQSNVTVADRIAELTTVSRSFEALQKSISIMLNDVDGRAIDYFGRR